MSRYSSNGASTAGKTMTEVYRVLLNCMKNMQADGKTLDFEITPSAMTDFQTGEEVHCRVGEMWIRSAKGSQGRMIYVQKNEDDGYVTDTVIYVGPEYDGKERSLIISNPNSYPERFSVTTWPVSKDDENTPGAFDQAKIDYAMGMMDMIYSRNLAATKPVQGIDEPFQGVDITDALEEAPAERPATIDQSLVMGPDEPVRESIEIIPSHEFSAEWDRAEIAGLTEFRESGLEQIVVDEDIGDGFHVVNFPNIDKSPKNSDEEERYSQAHVELGAISALVRCYDQLRQMDYDHFISVHDGYAYYLGSSQMLAAFSDIPETEPSREEMLPLLEQLAGVLKKVGVSKEEYKALSKQMLKSGHKYVAMGKYCEQYSDKLMFFDFPRHRELKPGTKEFTDHVEQILQKVFPDKGKVAVLCYLPELITGMIDYVRDRKDVTSFNDALVAKDHSLKVNGYTIYFVGDEARKIFGQYQQDMLDDISDLFMSITEQAEKKRRAVLPASRRRSSLPTPPPEKEDMSWQDIAEEDALADGREEAEVVMFKDELPEPEEEKKAAVISFEEERKKRAVNGNE
ncbi:hypothetical protein KY359_06660 [Candidatus Woesearchaeota archaeon]|nr:hypothetical protein [Candidatus Woesearchaeota archaeon]